MSEGLSQLARLAGVVDHWFDHAGYRRDVADDTLRDLLSALGLPCGSPVQLRQSTAMLAASRRRAPALLTTWVGVPTPLHFDLPRHTAFAVNYEDGASAEGHVHDAEGRRWLPPFLHAGYHRIEIGDIRFRIAVAPARAAACADSASRRPWGIALPQADTRLTLPSLAALAAGAAGYGADALAVGQLHGDHRHGVDPGRIGHGGLDQLAGGAPSGGDLRQFYLETLPRNEGLLREYLRFGREAGDQRSAIARHMALRQIHGNDGLGWPAALRQSGSAALQHFADEHGELVGYGLFLQWLGQRLCVAAQSAARAAGMSVGLIVDIASGAEAGGSEAWQSPQRFIDGFHLADPKDGASAAADDRQLLAFNPLNLVDEGLCGWIELLRSTMGRVGAVRLLQFDRCQRAWLQCDGIAEPRGAFVEYPFDDLLRLLVLESSRSGCVVIVDDRDALAPANAEASRQAGLLATERLLRLHERSVRGAASDWSSGSVAVAGVDDGGEGGLVSWWRAADIHERLEQGLVSPLMAARELSQRDADRSRLLSRLGIERRKQLTRPLKDRRDPLRAHTHRNRAVTTDDQQEVRLVDAALDSLAAAPATLMLVSLDDASSGSGDAAGAQAGGEAQEPVRVLERPRVRSRLFRVDRARRGGGPSIC